MALKWVSGHLSLRETSRRERLLQDLTGSPSLISDVDLLQRTICARVREIAGCQAALICEYAPAREAFVAAASNDLDTAAAEPLVIRASGRLARWLRVNEEPLPVPDTRGVYEYLDAEEKAVLASLGIRVCLPLVAVNRLVGILLLADLRASWRLSADELEFLGKCGRQIALVCESAYLQRAERERIRTAARAQQLAVAGQLAAAVAHEIRNPLHAIRSSVQYVMKSRSDSGPQDELLQNVLDEVDRIGHTITGLLSVSRPRELELSDIDLVDVAERAMKLMDPVADGAGVKMTATFECRPLPIRGDRNELGQVFVNVMLNACQAMTLGGRIEVTSRLSQDGAALEHGPPLAVIDVRDNGPGIDSDHLSKVFDPFFTTKVTGTGLGLPICLDIMTRHQGQIRVDSEPGHGTTVSISAPLRQATWPES
jgi:signal transduction histidine kinase